MWIFFPRTLGRSVIGQDTTCIPDSACQLTLSDLSSVVCFEAIPYSFIPWQENLSKPYFLCLCLRRTCWKERGEHNSPVWKVSFQIWSKCFPASSPRTLSLPLKRRSAPSSWLESQAWFPVPTCLMDLGASLATAASSLWSGRSPHSLRPRTTSSPCWLSRIWGCPSHPAPLCWGSLLSVLQQFPPMPALLKNSLSMESQIWSPRCSCSCLWTAFWPHP